MKRPLLALVFALAAAGCLGAGLKQFNAGEDAYKRGDLEAADKAYTEALAADPNNAKYKVAQEKVRVELAKKHEAEAVAKEKSGAWTEASAAWQKASELSPANSDYAVRGSLSGAKARNLGPNEWYEAVLTVQTAHPNNDIANRSLAGARAAAYKHHLDLAEGFLASGEGGRAFQHYSRAKEIDPTTPNMRADAFVRAEALSIAEQAEEKAQSGDAIGAYELYQQAYAKMPLPEIKAQMDQVKRRASAILSKLEAARREVERGRYERALKLYERVTKSGAVPASIDDEIKKVRAQLLTEKANAAKKLADRNQLPRAHRALLAAIDVAGLEQVSADVLRAALDLVKDGDPGKGREAIENAKLEEGSPLYEAAQAYAVAGARKTLKSAERLEKRQPTKALQIIAEISAFEDELPGIEALRRKLRADSFQDLIDDALKAAKKKDDREAASLLLAALNASAAPEAMRTPSTKGADELKAGNFAAAETAFTQALAAAPRSRLAQRGIDIARLRRRDSEKDASQTLISGKGNEPRAVEILAAGLTLEPANANARAAVDGLLKRLERSASLSDTEVADLVAYANKLAGLGADVTGKIDTGASSLREGDLQGAESAFGEALSKAPSARLAEVSRKVTMDRMLSALTSDAQAAVKGDESSAESLAELLKRDPNNPQAKKALADLIETAKGYAKDNNDKEAARYLKLATIATSPAPGVRAALDEANTALDGGKMGDAESKYSDAMDLEPTQPVAKAGFEIAKAARVAMLSGAIAQAKEGGNLDAAREALERTLKMDPNSPEAKKAFTELLSEAERQGDAGNDAQAAALLSAANVVSKPETVKNEIGRANDLLGKKDFDGAVSAYEAVASKGESKVVTTGLAIAKKRRVVTLVDAAAGLRNGSDEERGAEATAKLRKIDPANSAVDEIVNAAITRAEASAAKGDDAAAAKTLTAIAIAVGEEKQTKSAIELLAKGKYGEAEIMFGKAAPSDLTRRGQAIARGRKLGTLAKDISSGGQDAALAVKALLAADPNNKEAQKAFTAYLDKARAEGRAGNDKGAAEQLANANIAAGATDALTESIKIGIDHLGEGRYAEAERGFSGALEISKTSQVARTGHEIAKSRREKQEQDAIKAIAGSGDPRPHAKVLGASLIVEPSSQAVSKALAELMKRAERSAKRGADSETAQELEAAALLENKGIETVKLVTEASALYAKSSFEEAQSAFVEIGSAKNGNGSKVAKLGEELALGRRVSILEDQFAAAKKDNDVLRQADVAASLLKLDPNHREAKRSMGSLQTQVKQSRLSTAETHASQGKPGVAYVYLERALALDEDDKAARAKMDEVTAALKKRMDLVMVVDSVMRGDKVRDSDCKGFDPIVREETMEITSRRKDLGGWVLSPSWTEAWKKKDPKAPEVSGSIRMKLMKCQITPSTGKANIEWQILSPVGEREVSRGTLEATLPGGVIPLEEQDGAGKNARMAFAKHVAEKLGDAIEVSRDTTDLWLLVLAEHAVEKGDAVLAADAYARLRIDPPLSIKPDRMKKVEQFLEEKFR
ncbi:MAG: hypothetical protein RL846_27740 [Deltaproteobacteria bacterium]